MSEHTLAITYSGAAALEDTYWVRIEQDVVDEVATIADAASLLDALYDIDPCVKSETTSEDPATDLAAATKEALDLSYCDTEFDGSVEMEIKIIRSHLQEPATLRLRGGEVVSVVQESGQITVSLEITTELTLTYPVVTGFRCTPAHQERNGNTLRFAEDQVGLIMTATYTSSWEVAVIKVLGVDGETGTCQALAFHHGVVDDVEVQVPEGSEEDRSLCPTASWQPVSEQSQVTCYQDVVVSKKCACSEEEVDTYTYQQVVPCPDREIKCPGVLTECMHFLGTVLAVQRVPCTTDGYIPGTSVRYEVSDPDYYRKVCCREPRQDRPLPTCPEIRTTYTGSQPVEYGEEYWRELYGSNARIVPIPPPGGICGEWIIRQEVDSGNCCDGVDPMVWNGDYTPQTMGSNDDALIAVLNGSGRYNWTINGQGFFIGGPGRTAEKTTIPSARIFTRDACGYGSITVDDGCSTIRHTIRAAAGTWSIVPPSEWPAPTEIDHYDLWEPYPDESGLFYVTAYSGKYKIRQVFAYNNAPDCYADANYSMDEACAKGCEIRTVESSIDQAIALIDQSVPRYISPGVHMDLVRDGMIDLQWNNGGIPWDSLFSPQLCHPWIFCAILHVYRDIVPKAYCYHIAGVISPINEIDIWRWNCA